MKGWMIGLGSFLVVLFIIGGLFSYVVGINNREVRLRNTITAKQLDNTSEYDNMWKKISQVAQVTDAQKEALKEIFVGYAEARTQDAGANQIMTWVKESVPNVDTSTFNQLMNVITGSRDSFTFRQKELVDLKREHDIMLDTFPQSVVLSILGRQKIDIVIVTSTRTENAFKTGSDDDVQVFKK